MKTSRSQSGIVETKVKIYRMYLLPMFFLQISTKCPVSHKSIQLGSPQKPNTYNF